MVAPMKTMVPSSTWGRKASCCALLNRCTSSTKSTVPHPAARFVRAASTAARMSLMPARTAEIPMKSAAVAFAASRARVVLPEPGGPHRIIEWMRPPSRARRSGLPSPTKCPCPANSASERGRSRSASGVCSAFKSFAPNDVRPPAVA